MPLELHHVDVEGVRVPYRAAGEGDPLVLVHGLSGSWRWWRGNVDALARARRVVLVDLTDLAPGRRFDLEAAPAALRAFLAAAALEPADLVGHSMGGLVALRLAERAPEAVRRLVLVAPAVGLERRPLPGWALPLAGAVVRSRPSLLPLLAADALRAGPWSLLRAAAAVLAAGEVAEVAAPTLLLWGERDPLVPPRLAGALRDALPDARVELLAGAGHVPMVERPRAFEEAVLRFLS